MLIGNQRQNLPLLPVALPAVIQLERSQGCQTVTSEETPLPSTDLLAFSDQEVIGLFSPATANVALLDATLAIILAVLAHQRAQRRIRQNLRFLGLPAQ